jgi:hypothetical protein
MAHQSSRVDKTIKRAVRGHCSLGGGDMDNIKRQGLSCGTCIPICAAADSSFQMPRATKTTDAPALANATAKANPMPELAPVT